jgi:hypothetical protein
VDDHVHWDVGVERSIYVCDHNRFRERDANVVVDASRVCLLSDPPVSARSSSVTKADSSGKKGLEIDGSCGLSIYVETNSCEVSRCRIIRSPTGNPKMSDRSVRRAFTNVVSEEDFLT